MLPVTSLTFKYALEPEGGVRENSPATVRGLIGAVVPMPTFDPLTLITPPVPPGGLAVGFAEAMFTAKNVARNAPETAARKSLLVGGGGGSFGLGG